MSYDQTKLQARRSARPVDAGAATPVRAGAATYLAFALSVGFTGAVVIGLLA